MFVLFVNMMFLRTMNSKTFFGQIASSVRFILLIHIYFLFLASTPKCFFIFSLIVPRHPTFRTLLRLLARLADINKLGLQTGSTDKEPINILCLTQLATVLAIDGTAVNDTGRVGNLGGSAAREPGADGSVDFLRLGDGGDFAGANSPDGFVCKGGGVSVGIEIKEKIKKTYKQ